MSVNPELPRYHRQIVEYLRAEEPGLWNWFASSPKRDEEAAAIRLDLLKATYRLEVSSQPKLYEFATAVRDQMQLNCEITLYQAQTGSALNAGLAYLPGEAHIIFTGPIASALTDNELRAVMAHELGHFLLLELAEGAYLIANDLLRALATDRSSNVAAAESARLYNLWTEIYADRWACRVSADPLAAIAALIKVETGLLEVSAESYLRQADEIFAKSSVASDHLSHPEPYIRARALRIWADRGDDSHSEIERMIEGDLNLHRLDSLAQKRAANMTRQFLTALLAPKWFRSEAVLAHARQFFADFTIDESSSNSAEIDLQHCDSSLRDYFCYLMLDFVTVDRDLGEVALSAAIVQARRLGIGERFAELAQKELSLGKKAFAKLEKGAASLLETVETSQAT